MEVPPERKRHRDIYLIKKRLHTSSFGFIDIIFISKTKGETDRQICLYFVQEQKAKADIELSLLIR